MGKWVEIQTAWQLEFHKWERNEFIIAGPDWEKSLPWVIDAVFLSKGKGSNMARRVHEDFLHAYPELTEADCPLVVFDADNWTAPFSVPRPEDFAETDDD